MKKDKIIYLVNNTDDEVTTPSGEITYSKTRRKVFASTSSIKQSEFYQAQANGLKPIITFVIRPFEYKGEEEIEYSGVKYKILRTFEKSSTEFELTCEGNVNANSKSS